MMRALLFAMTTTLGALATQTPSYEDEKAAREMLDRAETYARRAQYAQARRTYPKIVEQFPGTAAAKVAERRVQPSAFVGWSDVVRRGESKNRVDFVIMGEGYELDHQKAFDDLAGNVPPILLRVEPFHEYEAYINFQRANLVSADAGVDGFGREYDTALGARTTATIQGHVAVDRKRVHAMLAELPEHDAQAIVYVKQGVLGTGGGGVATIGGTDARITVHEIGHSFAGLQDEYATANYEQSVARSVRAEFRGINASGTDDPKRVPWAHWIEARHPSIGVYEGASGQVRDAYRPVASGCLMNDGEFFCAVCREAIVLRIYSLVDPIESCEPAAQGLARKDPLVVSDEAPLELEVKVMQPATHELEVRWWILPESRFPATGAVQRDGERIDAHAYYHDRRERGPLTTIADAPHTTQPSGADGVYRLRLSRTKLDKGLYRVVCRAKDTAKPRGEKWPWVLKDERGLLESERAWWVLVR